MSVLMSQEKHVPLKHTIAQLYMDSMDEFDELINATGVKQRNPNYLKSNSLGILSAATIHKLMGPAILH
jgi:hypothetical protein